MVKIPEIREMEQENLRHGEPFSEVKMQRAAARILRELVAQVAETNSYLRRIAETLEETHK